LRVVVCVFAPGDERVKNARVPVCLRYVVVTAAALLLALPTVAVAQTPGPDDVVLWTATASPADVHGDWVREADSTAAAGVVLRNPDRGRSRISPALASPPNYFEMRFSAKRATAYHLWVRMRAQNNATKNDSVHVQFSDSVNATGQSIARIGSTGSAEVVLQNGPGGGSPQGWGWTDNGWGSLGSPIYFAADGTHVIRIQQREDGPSIDQIVLSPVTFASAAPGARSSDTRIFARALGIGPTVSAGTSVIRAASAAAGRIFGSWQTVSDSTAAGSQALRNPDTGAARIAPALSSPASYFEVSFNADAGRAYHVWVRMKTDGNSLSNDSVHFQFNDSVTSSSAPTARIGTDTSFEMVLQNGSTGPTPHGWGWTDNGWGALGTNVYFATTGAHTLRVQQREDGALIDQIVITPDTFLTSAPGWRLDDLTIFGATAAPPPPPSNTPPTVSLTSPTAGATFTAPATITLAATASDPENRLSKVEFFNGSTLLGTDTTAPYSFTWNSVAAGSYSVRAVATDADGASANSATVAVTVNGVGGGGSTLPNGQLNQDVGTPAVAGSAQFANGSYTVRGAGADIWGASDQFHFVYQPVAGDVVITARVASVQAVDTWSKAGVMIRETLTGGSRHAFAHPTLQGGDQLTRRVTTSGSTTSTATASGGPPPRWVRLTRSGNAFTMHRSNDGVSWTLYDSVQITMASNVYVGLAVTSHNASTATTAVFDNVSVSATPAGNAPPTVTLTAPASGATFTAPATITLSATASDPENRLSKVDFYNGSTLLATDTSTPFSFSWSSVPAGSYSLRAVATDADGASANSSTVSVTVNGVGPTLPSGQLNQDIGAPAIAGSVQYSGGAYTVRAGGADIWGTSDQFHYVYQPVSGDVVITARVASLLAVDPWSKGGVMIRETLTAGSRHAFAHASGINGFWLTRRVSTAGVSTFGTAASSGSAPGWVRLTRTGNTFTMHRSSDGVSWTLYDSVQITMASNVFVGLAVTSHNTSTATTAVFDNVSVTEPTNQAPSVALTGPANGATFTAPATITLSATAADPENRLSKVDFYNGTTLLGTDTTAPFSFTWNSVAAGTYQLKAVAADADGGTASSSTATITVSTTTSSTKRVAFTASLDHAIVTNYLLEVFPSTANPATATALTSSDLGKPTPDSNNDIFVDRTTFLNNLAPGNYLITVAAVAPGGKSRSTAISFTR
jgi:regulation of enolase protein 1 (concanavalin A-like superfamily)